MCLVTIQRRPEDLTGIEVYKTYRIKGGYLRNYYGFVDTDFDDTIRSLEYWAKKPSPVDKKPLMIDKKALMIDEKPLMFFYDSESFLADNSGILKFTVGPGYIHAFRYIEDALRLCKLYLMSKCVVVKGKLLGLGYKSQCQRALCAEGFLIEEIVYDPDEDGSPFGEVFNKLGEYSTKEEHI